MHRSSWCSCSNGHSSTISSLSRKLISNCFPRQLIPSLETSAAVISDILPIIHLLSGVSLHKSPRPETVSVERKDSEGNGLKVIFAWTSNSFSNKNSFIRSFTYRIGKPLSEYYVHRRALMRLSGFGRARGRGNRAQLGKWLGKGRTEKTPTNVVSESNARDGEYQDS